MPEIIVEKRSLRLAEFLERKAPECGLELRHRIMGYGYREDYIGLGTSRFSFGMHGFHKIGRVEGVRVYVLDPCWHSDLVDLLSAYEKLTGEKTQLILTKDPWEED